MDSAPLNDQIMNRFTRIRSADPMISVLSFKAMRKEREEIMLPSDPDMLASFLNMKLRDQYASLDALCDDLELDKEEIVKKLKEADYDYVPARNQFL